MTNVKLSSSVQGRHAETSRRGDNLPSRGLVLTQLVNSVEGFINFDLDFL